ncbi:MAG: putative non-ribosomal peptide synthetase [Benniella sp.]|nr:MAG: putative non-ribosomal peptide synthetase [Benniella sp.]
MVNGILAILKAGGTYVPFDPAYVSEPLKDILNGADPTIVLADKTGRASPVNPHPLLKFIKTSQDLAYIIQTSGSTSKPKGVMIEHRSVIKYAEAHIGISRDHNHNRVLLSTSICFDASVAGIMLPLSSGATLYLLLNSTRLDRDKFF